MTALADISRVQLAFLVLCALLTLLLIYEIEAPISEFTVSGATAPSQAALPLASGPPFVIAPAETFAAINERSVFDPARKAVVSKTEAGAAVATPPAVVLVGVIIDRQDRLALVKSPELPMATGVRLGESIDGWQVTAIEPDRIVLHAGTTDDEIKLEDNHGAPGDPVIPTPSQPPQ